MSIILYYHRVFKNDSYYKLKKKDVNKFLFYFININLK